MDTKEIPLKADPNAQLRLLDVQELDTRLDTLAHQLRSLPEIKEQESAEAEYRALHDRERDLTIAVSDLSAEQRRADRDVEQVKTRRERDRTRMEQGQITDPRALESMGHELESLERRITTLEDEELEVMEKLEEAQAHLSDVQRDMEGAKDRAASAASARQEKAGVLGGGAGLGARPACRRCRRAAGRPVGALREAARVEGRHRCGPAATR